MKQVIVIIATMGAIAAGGAVTASAGAGTGGQGAAAGQEAARERADTSALRSRAQTSETAATATARGRHPGTVLDAHLQDEGRPVWEVVIADRSGTHQEIQVDAASGEVVSDQADE